MVLSKALILVTMEKLVIEAGDDTPRVVLDKDELVFEISGRSLPEDAVGFYESTFKWMREYAKSPLPATPFVFKLDYFNTASSKLLLDMLKLLETIPGATVIWYSMEDDEEVEEAGEEFSEQVSVSFEFRTF